MTDWEFMRALVAADEQAAQGEACEEPDYAPADAETRLRDDSAAIERVGIVATWLAGPTIAGITKRTALLMLRDALDGPEVIAAEEALTVRVRARGRGCGVSAVDGLSGLAAREAMDPADYLAQCEAVHPITRDRCHQVRHPAGTIHWHENDYTPGRGHTWRDR